MRSLARKRRIWPCLLSLGAALEVAGCSPQATPAAQQELRPSEIQQHVDATHGSFVQFARALQEAGLKALSAIDAKDPKGLMDAGGAIDEACEACHVTYWYPNEKSPGS